MSYTYICFQPASHGDMTSSMVLKSPARPVLDGPVPHEGSGQIPGTLRIVGCEKNHGIPTQNGKMEPNGV